MRRFGPGLMVRRAWRLALIVAACCALAPSSSSAGTYTVTQTCGAWDAVNNAPAHVAVYTECPTLVLRNVGGPFSASAAQEGRWDFNPPPGTVVDRAFISGSLQGLRGWQATILTSNGHILENCPGVLCAGGGKSYWNDYGPLGAPSLMLRLRCGSDSCPNNDGIRGYLDARTVSITLADWSPPSVGITGGDLLHGWRRAVGTVSFESSDNVGIRFDRILVDGVQRGQSSRPCADGMKYPCPNGPSSLLLDTTRVPDGSHTLSVHSVDSAGNVGGQDKGVLIDNTAPAAAAELVSALGDAWQASNAFSLSWRNPRQAHAPIAGAEYELCPLVNGSPSRQGCTRGNRNAANITKVTDLRVPRAGAWRLRLWLRDDAGNHDSSTALETVLRFDDTPPTAVFLEQDPDHPTRLRLDAADTVSDLATAEVEVRRQGEDLWRPLPVKRRNGGFSALANDEILPRGLYDLRARVTDLAGNERSTTSRNNGQPAVLKLPVRARAGLVVGRAGKLRCRGRGRRRHCRRRLAAEPSVGFGRSTRLVGRLRSGGKPLADVPVKVFKRTDLEGAPWWKVAVLRSTPSGHVRYRARRGPARLLRFRYPGTAKVRGATAVVQLRVRAATSLRPSRHNVVNGEYVTFRGRVKSRPLPSAGKLVELQVFTRRRWRTFAQPRANPHTGRWAYQYRFEAIRGRVQFRFRARIRREAGYPFYTGTSRSARVTVRGL